MNNTDSKIQLPQGQKEQATQDRTSHLDQQLNWYYEKYQAWIFSEDKPPKPPQPFLQIDGELISSLGNLLIISGPPKSGKTSVSAALIAGSICPPGGSIDTLGLNIAPNHARGQVLYFNSELSHSDFHSATRKMLDRAGIPSAKGLLHSFNYVGLLASEILSKTLEAIQDAYTLGPIRLIVVDGIADYVDNVNDPEPCTKVVRTFMDIAQKHNAVVVLIIHKNPGKPGETKSRGHLGSELARKGEATLELQVKGQIVEITGTDLRNAGMNFKPRQIVYDTTKGYFVLKGLGLTNAETKKKDAITFLDGIYEGKEELGYEEIWRPAMEFFDVKDRSAKGLVTYFLNQSLIVKLSHGKYKRAVAT
ncbi:MAG: AAA family ATPase [Bacteroidetes bacterium]|nr:AAA family ATPase [Bacteroidota bacterium]